MTPYYNLYSVFTINAILNVFLFLHSTCQYISSIDRPRATALSHNIGSKAQFRGLFQQ